MVHFLIWTLVVIIYIPSFKKLYSIRWDLLDYTHSYFIIPVALWLIWRKRDEIKQRYETIEPEKNLPGLFSLLLGIFLFIFGSRFDYASVIAISLIFVLFGLTHFLYGKGMVKLLAFPFLYLLLLVPPPMGIIDSITLPMRYGISALAEDILRLFSYPISREGLLLTIGYNEIFMGQPCSGFRSLITLLSLGLVYIYISKGNWLNKTILTLFIIPLALIGNLIRVMTLCLITFYFGEEAGQGFFHNFSGIVMFIITILGLMGIESLINKKQAV